MRRTKHGAKVHRKKIMLQRWSSFLMTDYEVSSMITEINSKELKEKLEEKTGKFISIADEKAMSLSSSPFKNVQSLKNYIEDLVNEQ